MTSPLIQSYQCVNYIDRTRCKSRIPIWRIEDFERNPKLCKDCLVLFDAALINDDKPFMIKCHAQRCQNMVDVKKEYNDRILNFGCHRHELFEEFQFNIDVQPRSLARTSAVIKYNIINKLRKTDPKDIIKVLVIGVTAFYGYSCICIEMGKSFDSFSKWVSSKIFKHT